MKMPMRIVSGEHRDWGYRRKTGTDSYFGHFFRFVQRRNVGQPHNQSLTIGASTSVDTQEYPLIRGSPVNVEDTLPYQPV